MRFLIPSMCGTGAETRTDYRTWISLKGKLIIKPGCPSKGNGYPSGQPETFTQFVLCTSKPGGN
jgi:hypothetical protein